MGTALLDLMCNFSLLSSPELDVDTQCGRLQEYHRGSAEIGAGTGSKTGECISYPLQVSERSFVIIDSPGVEGVDATISLISDFCKKEKYLNCICFVVNGCLSARTVQSTHDLRALAVAIGNEMLENIFVVMTHVRDQEDATFE